MTRDARRIVEADELMRRVHETVVRAAGSMMKMVMLELPDEMYRKAAWKL